MPDGEGLPALAAEVHACEACPRLVEHRTRVAREKRRAYRAETYWGRPVMGHGDPDARLLVVGLAPAAHGANRTGRMFTGDRSADFLTAALWRAGFANQPQSLSADDGLRLTDAYVTAVVRCAPPDNRPLPAETAACRRHLVREVALLNRVEVVLCLGKIAWDGYTAFRRSQGLSVPHQDFGHGREERLDGAERGVWLVGSYHPSQQNTQTGRLTPVMMDAVMARVRDLLAPSVQGA